jgi:hypothetical protein
MIYINQGILNPSVAAVCSRNKTLSSPTYLWSAQHKLSSKSWKFIPFRIPPSVNYSPGYDLFTIEVDDTQPESFTASTSANTVNLHFYPGEYYVKIYEQASPTNLNPALSYDVVNETIMNVIGTNQNTPISYSGTPDIFIIYNSDND